MPLTDHTTPEQIYLLVSAVALRGDIIQEIRVLLKSRLAEKNRSILVDLPETRLMDSQGVSMFLYFHHILKRDQHRIRIGKASPELVAFLKNMALDFLI